MVDSWLVVGLGNPGPDYHATRHNIGHMVVDEAASRLGLRLSRHKTNSTVAEGRTAPGGPKMILAKPNSFMNLSGGPVAALVDFYSLSPEHLIVVHDELDIPFDTIRLKRGGGHGGHNGLRDIIAAIGTADFIRVRVGIGRPPGHQAAAEHVLKRFTATEQKSLPLVISDSVDAIEEIVTVGLTVAQNRVHSEP